jgi:HSP20 family molecular chaperone IbpA
MDIRKVPISVSINPSEYSGRSIRLGNSDIRDKMNQRMREFEEESRLWRDQFLSSSGLPQSSLLDHRPRMLLNFPEFPELGSSFSSPLSRLSGASPAASGFFGSPGALAQTSHKSFIEEDDHGNKKYKMVFEIGDFKPNEIQVKTEGRQLIVKGDRELVAGSATESKQFNREITLPDFIEPTSVTSFLSDGSLTIEAPAILDRLGYSNNNSITNSTSSSSTMRNSPFRDTGSPSRIGGTSLLSRNFPRDDLLNLTSAPLGSFNTPFFNETPSFSSHPTASNMSANQSISSNNAINSTLSSTSAASQSSPPATYKFNMSEFRPEDIAITVTDTTLKIHAVREESDTRGNGKTYREFFLTLKMFFSFKLIN